MRSSHDNVTGNITALTRKFLAEWNIAVTERKLKVEDVMLVETLALGILSIVEQQHESYKEYIGYHLLNLVKFINVDINGKNGFRGDYSNLDQSSHQLANQLEGIILKYLRNITAIPGIHILDKSQEQIAIPNKWIEQAGQKPSSHSVFKSSGAFEKINPEPELLPRETRSTMKCFGFTF